MWELKVIIDSYWKIVITFPEKFRGMCSKVGELAPFFILWAFFSSSYFDSKETVSGTQIGTEPETAISGNNPKTWEALVLLNLF